MRIQNRLAELMAEHTRKTGKRLTQSDLADTIGIARSTVSAYYNNDVTRFDECTLVPFLAFFGVGIGDFLVLSYT